MLPNVSKHTSDEHKTFLSDGSGQVHNMERLLPTQARRTLGVIFAPNGSTMSQIQTRKRNLETFIAKTSQCCLSNTLRWKAIKMIVEPGTSHLHII